MGRIAALLVPLLIILAACGASGARETIQSPPLLRTPEPDPSPPTLLPTVPLPEATIAAVATAMPTSPASPPPSPTATLQPTPTPCASPGQIISGTYQSEYAGSAQKYRLYEPPCYGADSRVYPTLYMLAGNIHDESKWQELGLGGAANEAISVGDIPPLLIVMPDGGPMANNTSGGPGSYESVILEDLIPHIESTTCAWGDSAGRSIGGLSRGGYWALEIAFRFPNLFASVGGHSAALLDTGAVPEINPQFTALSQPLGDLRIYLDIGRDDYLRANTIRLHEDMDAAGVAHTWVFNDGRHEDAYWSANARDYLLWYTAPWSSSRDNYPLCQIQASSVLR